MEWEASGRGTGKNRLQRQALVARKILQARSIDVGQIEDEEGNEGNVVLEIRLAEFAIPDIAL